MLIQNLSRGNDDSTVHIQWKVRTRNGAVHRFDFDGNAKAARAAAKSFEKSLKTNHDLEN